MSETQPVVLSGLKLAPQLQPFFRLKKIFHIFREKLEHFTLILAATQDPEGPDEGLEPKFLDVLLPLRSKAGDQVMDFSARLLGSGMSANLMVELVDSFPISYAGSDIPRPLDRIQGATRSETEQWEDIAKGMEEFTSATLSTVEKLREMLAQSENSSELSVFNEGNSQVVNELIQATREATSILRDHAQYWQTLADHFQDPKLFQSQSPPQDELTLVRESWTAYCKDLADLKSNSELSELNIDIVSGANARKTILANQFRAMWDKRARGQTKKTAPEQPRDIMDAATSGHISPTAPPVPHKRWSFLRSLFRRLFPFLFKREAS